MSSEALEEKHLGLDSNSLATGSRMEIVSICHQWRLATPSSPVLYRYQYSVFHSKVCSLGP